MNEFLTSNEWQWRLARTMLQGVLGVVVANLDLLLGAAVLDPTWRALCVALVMALLSPVMAELGAVPADFVIEKGHAGHELQEHGLRGAVQRGFERWAPAGRLSLRGR